MAQAIMDPEEVRRFANELKRFNDDVQGKASAKRLRSAGSSRAFAGLDDQTPSA